MALQHSFRFQNRSEFHTKPYLRFVQVLFVSFLFLIYIHIYIYIYVCICMYLCMYVCMHVCMCFYLTSCFNVALVCFMILCFDFHDSGLCL